MENERARTLERNAAAVSPVEGAIDLLRARSQNS